jgi:hypothetical protein
MRVEREYSEDEPVTLGVLRFGTIHVDFEGDAVALNRVLAAFDPPRDKVQK